VRAAAKQALPSAEAIRVQRERQQGLGRPIVSAELRGHRFVAVKNRLLHSQKWKTFHDFLLDYIKAALGSDWGNAELQKPLQERHPVLNWHDHLCRLQREFIKEPGKVSAGPMTGAASAYLWLAYDLYCLDHNAELQKKLLDRLRNADNFAGARYEVFTAASLIRAGFVVEFENEDARGSSHCEFTATSKRAGRKYSVECKRRDSGTVRGRIKLSKLGRKLRDALVKSANHTRIVFIDLNIADKGRMKETPAWIDPVLQHLRKFEFNKANSGGLPSAYVVFTNFPYSHFLDETGIQGGGFVDAFKIPDFSRHQFPSLREAINARKTHSDMHDLVKSFLDHSSIPSTFDGEIPEFAFGDAGDRLLIGRSYLVKDKDGNDRVGTIRSATVNEAERTAYCAVSLESGEQVILTWPLREEELAAYSRHPDTFFGQVGQRTHVAKDPLDLYDFFFGSFSKTPKEKLLELMAKAPDIEALRELSQVELASVYSERHVNTFLASAQKKAAKNGQNGNRK